jgi:hypothetical protein
MNTFCVNIKDPEFKKLAKQFNMPESAFAGYLSRYMESVGDSQTLPTYYEIATFIDPNFRIESSSITEYYADTLPGQSISFTVDTLNVMDALFFTRLFSDEYTFKSRLNELGNVKQSQQFYGEVYGSIKEFLSETVLPNVTEKRPELIPNFRYLIDNFNDIMRMHSKKLSQYDITISFKDADVENLGSATEKDTTSLVPTASIELSPKTNAAKSVKYVLHSIINTDKRSEFYGLPLLYDFGPLFNKLANVTSGTTSIIEKLDILKNKSDAEPAFTDVILTYFPLDENLDINSISNMEYTHSELMSVLQFNQTFSKHYYDYVFTVFDGEGSYNRINSNTNSNRERIAAKWRNSIKFNSPAYTTENNTVVYNKEYFKKYRGIWDRNTAHNNTNRDNLDAPLKELLSDLGISFTHNRPLTKGVGKRDVKDIKDRIEGLVENIITGKTKNIFYRNLSDDGGFREMVIDHEISNSLDAVDNSHYLNGKTKYNISLNSYLTLITDEFNNVTTKAEFIKNNPQYAIGMNNSIFMSDVYWNKDGTRNSIPLNITIEEQINSEKKDVEFDETFEQEKYVWEFNSILNGAYPFLRAGDNSIERSINIGNGRRYNTSHLTKLDEVLNGYILDEIELLQSYNTAETGFDAEYNILNKLSKNPAEKSIFGDFMDDVAKKEYNKLILGKQGTINLILKSVKTLLAQNFDSQADTNFEYMVQNGMVELNEEGTYDLIAITPLKSATALSESALKTTIKVYLLNRYVGNIEQTKFFTGHPELYKDADNFFKRMSALVGTKSISTTKDINRAIDAVFENDKRLYKNVVTGETISYYQSGFEPIIRTHVTDDVYVGSTIQGTVKGIDPNAYGRMNKGDAIGLIDMPTYRDMFIRSGDWTQQHEALYYKDELGLDTYEWDGEILPITRESTTNIDGTQVVFSMLKPQYFGPLAEVGFIPGMYKLSLLPLRKAYRGAYPDMKRIMDSMDKNNVGILTFVSANKVGTKLNDGKLNDFFALDNAVTQDTYFKYWGIQLATGKSLKRESPYGSQFNKHLYNGLFNNGKPINKKAEQLATRLQKLQDDRINYGLKQLTNRFGLVKNGDESYSISNINELITTLESAATDRNADANTISTINVLRDNIEQFGLDIIVNREMLENIIMSIVDKNIFSRPMPGGPMIQAPGLGFENIKQAVINGKTVLVSDDLHFYHEGGYMEVYLPAWFGNAKNISEVDPKLLEAIGFRIPTSGLNSIERIKIAGFLPASAGNTVVLPSEIVEKAGSDFDVDKLYMYLKHFVYTPNSKYKYQVFSKQAVEADYESYKSKLLSDITNLAKYENRKLEKELGDNLKSLFDSLTEKLSKQEADTDFIESVIKEQYEEEVVTFEQFVENLQGKNKAKQLFEGDEILDIENGIIDVAGEILALPENKVNLLNPVSTSLFVNLRNEIKGKKVPASTSAIMSNSLVGLGIKHRNVESKRGTGVAALQLVDYVNAVRHGFKRKKIYKLHEFSNTDGEYTLFSSTKTKSGQDIGNTLNQFVNMFVDGAKDPLAADLNFTLNNANVIAYMIRSGIDLDHVSYLMNQPIIREYTRMMEVNRSFYSESKKESAIVKDLEEKYGTSNTVAFDKNTLKKEMATPTGRQTAYLRAFLEYKEDSDEYSNYIQASRIDTEGGGKNTTELDYTLANIERYREGEVFMEGWNSMFDEGGFLNSRYNALKEVDKILENFYTYKRQTDTSILYNLLLDNLMTRKVSIEDKGKVLDLFKRDLLTYKLMNNEVIIENKSFTIRNEINRLFIGKDSLPLRIQKAVEQGSDNYLLNSLQPILHLEKVGNKIMSNLQLYDQRLDKVELDALTNSWRELFTTHPDIARDLIMFAIAQDGFQTGPMAFTKLIPYEYYIAMLTSSNNANIPSSFLAEFILHNASNNLIGTRVYFSEGRTSFRDRNAFVGVHFNYVDEVQTIKDKNKRKEEILRRKSLALPVYKRQPTIYINNSNSISKDLFQFYPNSFTNPIIKDYKSKKSLQMYGIMTKLKPEKQQGKLTEAQIKNIVDIDIEYVEDFYKKCLGLL